MTARASTHDQSNGGRTLWLLVPLAMMAPLAIDMYLPAIETIRTEFGTSDEAITASISVFFAGLALGQLFFGPWSDRVGRRKSLLVGLVTFALGGLIAGFSENIAFLLMGRLLQALGGSAVMVSGRATVRDLFEERSAARFFSTIALFGGLAPTLAPAMGAMIMALAGWRIIFLLLVLFACLLFVAVYFLLPESRSSEAERDARGAHPFRIYAELLRNRTMLGYIFAGGFNSAAFYTYIASAPLIFMQTYHLSPAAYSVIVAVNSLGLVGASQINRMLLKRWTPAEILAGARIRSFLLAAAFAFFALTGLGGMPAVLALFFAIVSSNSIVQANCMACALSVSPQRAGAAAALFGAIAFGLGSLFSLSAGFLFDGSAGPVTIVMAFALLGAGAAIHVASVARTIIRFS